MMAVDSRTYEKPLISRAPRRPLPPGACDCHAHVFGPYDRFRLLLQPTYDPPYAPREAHADMLRRAGLSRGVLVQATGYLTDCDALADACRRSGGQIRGVGAATAVVPDAELDKLHEAGLRGLRFIEVPNPVGGGRYPGGISLDELIPLAPRMKERGWSAQVWAPIDVIVANLPRLKAAGIPIVLDHMGQMPAARGVNDPAFQALLGAVGEGHIWIKLSVCRVSQLYPDYDDARALVDAFVRAAPQRLLWASDWPHVRLAERRPDVGHLIDLFDAWIDDPDLRRQIFVDNPQALYGFKPASNP
jgi:2-pyrone-4,6-dicarboxylate lactonase